MPSSSTRNRRKWKVEDEPTIEMRKGSQWVLHAGGISFNFRGYVRRGRHSVITVSGERFDASEGDSMLMIIGPLSFKLFHQTEGNLVTPTRVVRASKQL